MKDRNRFNQILLIVLFCILIIALPITYKFVSNKDRRVMEGSNAIPPVLNVDNYDEFPSLYDEYYNNTVPYKGELVNLNSKLMFKYFNISPNSSVIKGKDGWLFYNSKHNEESDSLGDYQGTNKYTEGELALFAKSLNAKKEFLDERGIEFHIMIVPNKEQIYPEYMPSNIYKNEGTSKTDELVAYLEEHTDVNIIYLKDEMLNYKENLEYDIYNKTDSHWNNIGAYLGFVALMKEIDPNFKPIPLEDLKMTAEHLEDGDLAAMLALEGELEDIEYEFEYREDIKIELTEYKGKAMNRYKSINENGKKLLMYRDSFTVKLAPFLNKEFEESAFVWGIPFNQAQVEREDPDIVVVQVAERLTDYLKE